MEGGRIHGEGAEKSKPALLRRARANVPFLKAHRQECLCHYRRKRREPGRTSLDALQGSMICFLYSSIAAAG